MINELEALSKEDLLEYIAKILGITDYIANLNEILEIIIAEYIRFLMIIETATGNPVHTNRIIGQVTNRLFPLLQEKINPQQVVFDTEGHPVYKVLNKLITIREIEHIGGGFHVPTPTRLVKLPSGNGLLISCLPRRQITNIYGFTPQLAGLTKTLLAATFEEVSIKLTNSQTSVEQTFIDWLDLPSESIEQWIGVKLQTFKRRLKTTRISIDEFEYYDPSLKCNQIQALRWRNSVSALKYQEKGICLCRTKSYPRRYWLGEISILKGEPRLISEIDIPVSIIRRMHYGMDALWKNPTQVSILQRINDFEIRIPDLLPDAEMRFFIALGLDVTLEKNKLPFHFILPMRYLDDTRQLLANLGVEVKLRREV